MRRRLCTHPLQRDSSCRVYVVPSAALEPALLRPDIVPRHHPDGDDAAANAALASCNNAISFVLSNDALHQFVQVREKAGGGGGGGGS